MTSNTFTFIDLFAGIGGFRMGFERAGGICLYTCEWNKFSKQTYEANFTTPNEKHRFDEDITEVSLSDIPEHDLLVAGFPCQPFSIAGVSKKNSLGQAHGFNCQTQGTLFFEIERILAAHQPSAFVLENVKNLERHDKGNTFKIIRETLDGLGYSVQWRIIDAKGYVPQHRERIFIVGFLKNLDFIKNEEFSLDDLDIKPANSGPRLSSILHPQDGSEPAEPPFTIGRNGKIDKKYTLTPKLWQYLQDYAEKHKAKGNGFGFGLCNSNDVARTLSARYYKDGSEILIKQERGRPRRLTPRECARLMGFDRVGEEPFKIPVSDTQAYKQFGNAVAVPVVEAIATYMKDFLLRSQKARRSQLKLPLAPNNRIVKKR